MKKLIDSDEFINGLELEGFVVKHRTFGIGTIVSNVANRIQVKFQNNETKWLGEPEAKLKIVSKVEPVQDFEETSSEQEEPKSDTDKLEDRINELEQNARIEVEKQRQGKENRKDNLIGFAILAFFPVMFMIGAFGPCLDC